MKNLSRRWLGISLLLLNALGGIAKADPTWPNRVNVVIAAQRLAREIEFFDEVFHSLGASPLLIQKVHHFEETAKEFADQVTRGANFAYASAEYYHIRADINVIAREITTTYAYLLRNHYQVGLEWHHVWQAYRGVDYEMYRHVPGRLSYWDIVQLQQELRRIDLSHQASPFPQPGLPHTHHPIIPPP